MGPQDDSARGEPANRLPDPQPKSGELGLKSTNSLDSPFPVYDELSYHDFLVRLADDPPFHGP